MLLIVIFFPVDEFVWLGCHCVLRQDAAALDPPQVMVACLRCLLLCDARCFVDLMEESTAIDLNLGDDVAKKISKTSMNSYVTSKKSNGRILTYSNNFLLRLLPLDSISLVFSGVSVISPITR